MRSKDMASAVAVKQENIRQHYYLSMLRMFAATAVILLLMLSAGIARAEIVNINTADAKALQTYLKGIGAAKAKAIVEYRKTHGEFKSVDELRKVRGIGKKLVEKNRENLSISAGVSTVDKKSKAKASKDETVPSVNKG